MRLEKGVRGKRSEIQSPAEWDSVDLVGTRVPLNSGVLSLCSREAHQLLLISSLFGLKLLTPISLQIT